MLDQLLEDRRKLAEAMRNYSRSQKILWQQVPDLALEADGRSGYLDETHRNVLGIRALPSGTWDRTYHLFVDLETGDLVSGHELRTLSDDDVLKIKPDDLDASRLVRELIERGAREDNEEAAAWRDEMRRTHGLTPGEPFRRKTLQT